MSRRRLILAGVVAAVVLALIFGAVSNGQRDAWTQGYLVGRLAAVEGTDTLAAVGLLPYAYGYPQRGPGFGGFLFLLLGIGALFFVGGRVLRMAQWRAWAAEQGIMPEGQASPPWGRPFTGCGGDRHQSQTTDKSQRAEMQNER